MKLVLWAAAQIGVSAVFAQTTTITDVPDYDWYAGCWGTCSGNLMGYWDRHGFPDFYSGPTGGGVAPLNSYGANEGIRSMWASMAGFDGRPADQPGHADDDWTYLYYDSSEFVHYSYESVAPDPYVLAGRKEHAPDCLCDFMGVSQNKWTDLDGECSGNIDGFAYNFWDKQGNPRVNFTPPSLNGTPVLDVQSGLRNWTKYRGYDSQVMSQLADFNPNVPPGAGFTFENLKAEIDAGYPVGLMLQDPNQLYRDLTGMPHANPEIHAMLAFGYLITGGQNYVHYRTSWGDGGGFSVWGPQIWQAEMPLRGVITFHPLPKIRKIEAAPEGLTISWDGPSTMLTSDNVTYPAHWYAVEMTEDLNTPFTAVSDPTSERTAVVPNPASGHAFFRVKLMTPEQAGKPRG